MTVKKNKYTDLIKIHQDADHLDHFGTLDIWRSVAYTIGNDRTIEDAIGFFKTGRDSEPIRWRDELHYEVSKRIFDDREQYMQSFIERLTVEGVGEIWDEGALGL